MAENTETAILLAAYGTAVPEARRGYAYVEARVRDAHPGLEVRWAFTSAKVLARMRQRSGDVLSVSEALETMREEGFRRIAIQSLHTVPGSEFIRTREAARDFEDRHGEAALGLGRPLLGDQADIELAVRALRDYIPGERKPGEAVVLVGHGTEHEGHKWYAAFHARARQADRMLLLGTLEGEPGFDAVLSELRRIRPQKVWLVPFLSVAGYHVREDVAGDAESSWLSRFRCEGFTCSAAHSATTEHGGFVDIWLAHLRQALDHMEPRT